MAAGSLPWGYRNAPRRYVKRRGRIRMGQPRPGAASRNLWEKGSRRDRRSSAGFATTVSEPSGRSLTLKNCYSSSFLTLFVSRLPAASFCKPCPFCDDKFIQITELFVRETGMFAIFPERNHLL